MDSLPKTYFVLNDFVFITEMMYFPDRYKYNVVPNVCGSYKHYKSLRERRGDGEKYF